MDDESYIREAIDLAEQAVSSGNPPFGSLLVVDETVLQRDANTTLSEDDITAHPELKLARWAASELDPERRTAATMYTSAEPCAMCAGAVYYAGLGSVVYSASGTAIGEIRDTGGIDIPCAEVIERGGGTTTVHGPVLENESLDVIERYYG